MTVEPGGPSGSPMSERMQSLLSRAVEDQLSEQRQLAGALGDVRAQLTRIAEQVESLRAAGNGAPVETALSAVSGDVRESTRLLAERLDGVARLVQQRGSDLAEIRATIAELESVVRGHTDALGGISGGLAALPAYGDRIGGLQDNVAALHERLADLESLGTAVTTLQQRIDAMDQGLRELRSAFTGIGSRMAELPGRADFDRLQSATTEPLGEVAGRLLRIESAVRDLAAEDDSDAVDAEHEWLRSELARFAASVKDDSADITSRLDAVESSVTALTRRLEDALADDEQPDETDDAPDPVLTELARLREELLGDDGLSARVEALADDDVETKVAAAVEEAVGAAEERLAAHIDSAVLALAEALLRKRGRGQAPAVPRTTPLAASPAAAPSSNGDEPADTPDELDETAPDEADEADAGDEVYDGDVADDAGPDAVADVGPHTPWQVPPATAAAPADPSPRRKPWWRPGE